MVLPSTAVFFHGTYREAKSVVPRNTISNHMVSDYYRHVSGEGEGVWGNPPELLSSPEKF